MEKAIVIRKELGLYGKTFDDIVNTKLEIPLLIECL